MIKMTSPNIHFLIFKNVYQISTTWKAISFASEQKYFIFKETEPKAVDDFLSLKCVQILNSNIEIDITCANELNENKRFIHHKNLISLTDELILEYVKTQNVISLFRIKRKDNLGNRVSTGSFIIQFKDKQIPSFINIEFIEIKVQNLENRPMRCIHCFLIGHTISKCRLISQRLCVTCHYPTDDLYNHICVQDCKNCQLTHNSSSRQCPKYIEQQDVIHLKEKYGLSHQEASRKLKLNRDRMSHGIMNERKNDKIDDELKTTINSQQNEVKELKSTIEIMKEEHRNKAKELITKHVKDVQKAVSREQNCVEMIKAVQARNSHLDIKIGYLLEFVNSTKIINEFAKFKKKINIEI